MTTMFIRGFETKNKNIKFNIKNKKEIFVFLKEYSEYADFVKPEDVKSLRIKVFKLINNNNVKEELKNTLNEMLKFIINVEKNEEALYWH